MRRTCKCSPAPLVLTAPCPAPCVCAACSLRPGAHNTSSPQNAPHPRLTLSSTLRMRARSLSVSAAFFSLPLLAVPKAASSACLRSAAFCSFSSVAASSCSAFLISLQAARWGGRWERAHVSHGGQAFAFRLAEHSIAHAGSPAATTGSATSGCTLPLHPTPTPRSRDGEQRALHQQSQRHGGAADGGKQRTRLWRGQLRAQQADRLVGARLVQPAGSLRGKVR